MVSEGEIARFYATIDANISGLQRGVATAKAEMATLGPSATTAAGSARGAFSGIGSTIALGLGVGAVAGVTGALKNSVGAVMSYETAFTSVKRTVEGTPAQFAKLDESLRRMATSTLPASRDELARVAAIGGQMGIAIGDIPKFVDTVVRASVSTNGVLGLDETAQLLGRLSGPGLLDMPISDVDKLASAILKVGDESQANEAEVGDFALRLAGAGRVVGITRGEVLALAAVLPSLGLNAEAGGTAISQVWLKMQEIVSKGLAPGADQDAKDQLELLASTAGVSADVFAQRWGVDAAGAFMLFLDGVKGAGKDIAPVFDELGFGGVRATDTLLRLSSDTGFWREQIDFANQSLADGKKIIEDSGAAFETTTSKVTLLKNNITELGDEIAGPLVDKLNASLPGVSNWVRQFKEIYDEGLIPRLKRQMVEGDVGALNGSPGNDLSPADKARLQDALRGRQPTSEGTEYDAYAGYDRGVPKDIGGAYTKQDWNNQEGALDAGEYPRAPMSPALQFTPQVGPYGTTYIVNGNVNVGVNPSVPGGIDPNAAIQVVSRIDYQQEGRYAE